MPYALWALCGVEALWAFAFYAVQTTLTLYMTGADPRAAPAVEAWRATLSSLLGRPLAPLAAATLTYGLFSAAAYALPLAGGLVGDLRERGGRGRRRGVLAAGLLVLAAGHALYALPQAFLFGLVGIAAGTGLLKSNLVAQIGRTCAQTGVPRGQGFALYLVAANVGSLTAPLVCGTIGERLGWSAAYAAAAAAALLALPLYASAWPRLLTPSAPPATPDRGREDAGGAAAGRWRLALVAPLLAEVLFFGAYNQAFAVFPVWAQAHVDRRILGFEAPVTWFGLLDGLFTIAATLVALRLWARGRGGSPARRVAIGAGLGAAGFVLLAAAAVAAEAGRGRVGLAPAAGFFLLVDAAIPWVDATALARLATLAPAGREGGVSGLYFLSAAAAALLTGAVGALYDPRRAAGFWLLNALLVGGVALAAWGMRDRDRAR